MSGMEVDELEVVRLGKREEGGPGYTLHPCVCLSVVVDVPEGERAGQGCIALEREDGRRLD